METRIYWSWRAAWPVRDCTHKTGAPVSAQPEGLETDVHSVRKGKKKDWNTILATYRLVLGHQELCENNEWIESVWKAACHYCKRQRCGTHLDGHNDLEQSCNAPRMEIMDFIFVSDRFLIITCNHILLCILKSDTELKKNRIDSNFHQAEYIYF